MEGVNANINKLKKQIEELREEVSEYRNLENRVFPLMEESSKRLEEVRKLHFQCVDRLKKDEAEMEFVFVLKDLKEKTKKLVSKLKHNFDNVFNTLKFNLRNSVCLDSADF